MVEITDEELEEYKKLKKEDKRKLEKKKRDPGCVKYVFGSGLKYSLEDLETHNYKDAIYEHFDPEMGWTEEIEKFYKSKIDYLGKEVKFYEKKATFYVWLKNIVLLIVVGLTLAIGIQSIGIDYIVTVLAFISAFFVLLNRMFRLPERHIEYTIISSDLERVKSDLREQITLPINERETYPVKFYNKFLSIYERIVRNSINAERFI